MKKFALLLALLMLFTTNAPALVLQAEADGMSLMGYTYTSIIAGSLSISSSGLASYGGQVTTTSTSYTSKVSVTLQQYKGGSWISYASCSGSVGAKSTKQLASGYSYRVYVSAKIYSGGALLENPTKTTTSKYY